MATALKTVQPSGRIGTRRRAVAGLLIGACAALPAYVGPRLDIARRVEIVDHVVPGLVVVAVSAAVLAATRRTDLSDTSLLVAALVVLLAGLWMAATHLPLVVQAARHEAPWGATLYMSASAAIVVLLGLVWAKASWAGAA